jgi:hypothetical protein
LPGHNEHARILDGRCPSGVRAPWSFRLYPEAGEGGGCFRSVRGVERAGGSPDPGRSAAEAGRRARGKLRRYCAANLLNRFATLTYAGGGCHDPQALRADVASFFRALRGELGGPLPYAWVPEWHPGGHGLHVHFAVGRYVPRRLVEDAWGRGFVTIKLIGNLPVGSGARAEARVAGAYLAKYVSKDFGGSRAPGLHRYEVAQGFQPASVEYVGRSPDEVIERASERLGAAPRTVWLSSKTEGWHGPPACWAQWN